MLNVEDLKQKLSEAGLRVKSVKEEPLMLDGKRPDFLVSASIDDRDIKLVIEVKDRPHLAELRLAAEQVKRYQVNDKIPMIASHFFGLNGRALLKEMGIGYMDMSGNMHLRAPGIFIERDGKLNRFIEQQRHELNPYADKASIILRLLLEEPQRSWRIREIARAGGINPGWASRVNESLVERGLVKYDQEDGIALLRGEDVLKEWADLYDWHKNKFYYYYCHAYDMQELLNKVGKLNADNGKIALGFQAGANLVAPYATYNQVHLLIDGSSFDAMQREIEGQLNLEQRKEGANLILVQPYYRSSALFHAQKIDRWWVASDIQLYLDLNRYPLRGREQAENLMEKIIRPKFNKVPKEKHGRK
ncbi:MAG: type IV toxin-antitoxin system AbiEi family antitoxin [Dehalococcoidia bacterium]|jgi:hypothetical protein